MLVLKYTPGLSRKIAILIGVNARLTTQKLKRFFGTLVLTKRSKYFFWLNYVSEGG